jgi:adenosylcobinamide-phosphate synthase
VVNHPLAAALGIVADRVLGEPPTALHPVALLGRTLEGVERHVYADSRRRGLIHATVGLAIGVVAGTAARSTALATYVSVAGRGLGDAACALDRVLAGGDIEQARALLPTLVGRDPSQLCEPELVRAVIESVAENTVDAVVAPALWAAALGAPGAFGHRAVNTMDAMVGHRDARYARYGWAAARLDDAAAWVPARVTAVLVGACRPIRIVRQDAAAHPSPNAGVAEAAFAAALGIRLGGEDRYADRVVRHPTLGRGRAPVRADIARAVTLSRDVTSALAVLLVAVGTVRRERR